ncbi:MAG: uridine kinase [Deltaproteobacteria bacterium]|nr:uridine kinase [Deltaproteobacteria bacterium]
MSRSLVIGIAGGSGSGKTTVAELIASDFREDRVVLISQDSYYKELGHLPLGTRARVNFDHPDSIDSDLMADHVRRLRDGETVDIPIYDFATHNRRPEMRHLEPRDVLIVEGILILALDEVRSLLDVKIYIDTDDDIRFIRRLKRDIHERGRTVDSVIDQYLDTVRPMHLEFVEKSKRRADIILPWRDFNTAAVGMVINMVRGFVELDQPARPG